MFIEHKKDLLKALAVGFLLAVFGYFPLKLAAPFVSGWLIFVLFPFLAVSGISAAIFIGRYVPIFFQIAKFAGIGALNTFIDFSILNFLLYVFQIYGGWQVGIFNAVSFSTAVVNSYFWNKYWVFEHKKEVKTKELSQFLAISVLGVLINSGIVYVLTTWVPPMFGVSPLLWANLAKFAATLMSLIWNFIGYKFIVFK